ncbi:halocyanin domain-containing protein [Halobaculum lipolyticum]|uniref:Halocyanin domain-containing protein n=1 Tax=Halobaculum lipolyticum TaxID=3032001 RepID=A0ABD5W7M7_9EURY|nr:halocyanin domain-containing protein [Halobaculum sp. DT31]
MSDPLRSDATTDATGLTRRRLLAAVGAAGAAALAGCSGAAESESGPYDGYLANASGFDGEVADRTGSDEVTIAVGAGDGFAYDPAAVRVSPGTTVVWEWTGMGSRHNVAAEDGSFGSQYYASEGQTYSREFADPGVTKYYCDPHRNLGMVGVVEVVEG